MTAEAAFSIAMLTGFIWAARVLVPRAIRSHDGFALACAVLTALLALFAWLSVGVSMRSAHDHPSALRTWPHLPPAG